MTQTTECPVPRTLAAATSGSLDKGGLRAEDSSCASGEVTPQGHTQTTYSFEELLLWLESFQTIETGKWKFNLPSEGMPEQIANIVKLHMTGQTT